MLAHWKSAFARMAYASIRLLVHWQLPAFGIAAVQAAVASFLSDKGQAAALSAAFCWPFPFRHGLRGYHLVFPDKGMLR